MTEDSKAKVFDAEETREEQAQRLTTKRTNTLVGTTKAARRQYRLHVSKLTDVQRRSLAAYLRRDFEQTLSVIEDASQDVPEFSFVPDFAEEI